MKVGVLKEIVPEEKRVSLTPAGVEQLVQFGHEVYVEKDAGAGSGIEDRMYEQAGAQILPEARNVFDVAELVLHVKEILPVEYEMIKENQVIFTYLHLAAKKEQTIALQKSGCVAIAYETVKDHEGHLPLLHPMSEVAGRMSIQEGARFLEITQGGGGVLLGGVPGVKPAKVVIIGAGVVGTNAAKIAIGMGADVTMLDKNLDRLRYLDDIFHSYTKLIMSSPMAIREEIRDADLVIGAVLIPGAKAPYVVTREMVKEMKSGSVMVDVAIDQGGCFETSIPTTHSNPVYYESGVVHYCVSNMAGAVAKTSTYALTNATFPYVLTIANKGWEQALREDRMMRFGLNVCKGNITHRQVASAHDLPYTPYKF